MLHGVKCEFNDNQGYIYAKLELVMINVFREIYKGGGKTYGFKSKNRKGGRIHKRKVCL